MSHLAFFQELPGKQHHAGRAIPNLPIHSCSVMLGIAELCSHSHLSVLRLRDVHQRSCGGVDWKTMRLRALS